MAKGYFVVTYRKITNQEKWAAYAKLAVPAIQKSGGRFVLPKPGEDGAMIWACLPSRSRNRASGCTVSIP